MNIDFLVKIHHIPKQTNLIDFLKNSFYNYYLGVNSLKIFDEMNEENFQNAIFVNQSEEQKDFMIVNQLPQLLQLVTVTQENTKFLRYIDINTRILHKAILVQDVLFIIDEDGIYICKGESKQFFNFNVLKQDLIIVKIFDFTQTQEGFKIIALNQNKELCFIYYTFNHKSLVYKSLNSQSSTKVQEVGKAIQFNNYVYYTVYGVSKIYQVNIDSLEISVCYSVDQEILDFSIHKQNQQLVIMNQKQLLFIEDQEIVFSFETKEHYQRIEFNKHFLTLQTNEIYPYNVVFSWDTKRKLLKSLYSYRGISDQSLQQENLKICSINENQITIYAIQYQKQLQINKRKLNINIKLDQLNLKQQTQFLPLKYVILLTSYGYDMFLLDDNLELQNQNTEKSLMRINILQLIFVEQYQSFTKQTLSFNIPYQGKKNPTQGLQFHTVYEKYDGTKVLVGGYFFEKNNSSALNENNYCVFFININNLEFKSFQFQSPLNSFCYHKQTDIFFMSIKKNLFWERNQQTNSYIFDRPITVMKCKDNVLMCADDRNSVHLYQIQQANKEISYLGGEDKGRNIVDCGWLKKKNYFYNIDQQNQLNVFSSEKIQYYKYQSETHSFSEHVTPFFISPESFTSFHNFKFNEKILKFIEIDETMTQMILKDYDLIKLCEKEANTIISGLIYTNRREFIFCYANDCQLQMKEKLQNNYLNLYKINAQLNPGNPQNIIIEQWAQSEDILVNQKSNPDTLQMLQEYKKYIISNQHKQFINNYQ